MSHLRFALLVSALLPAASAIADSAMQGENLLQALPHGYKIGYQTRQGQMSMSEMVPSDESVESWTSMVTTQVFHGARIPADAFQQRLAANLSGACSSANAVQIDAGEADGYTYALWQHVCPLNPATGKPEHFWSKTIEATMPSIPSSSHSGTRRRSVTPTWRSGILRESVCATRAFVAEIARTYARYTRIELARLFLPACVVRFTSQARPTLALVPRLSLHKQHRVFE